MLLWLGSPDRMSGTLNHLSWSLLANHDFHLTHFEGECHTTVMDGTISTQYFNYNSSIIQRSTNQGWLSSVQETGTGAPNPCLMKVQFCPALSPLVQRHWIVDIVQMISHCQDPLIICHHRMLHLLHRGSNSESTFYLWLQFLVQFNTLMSNSPKGKPSAPEL